MNYSASILNFEESLKLEGKSKNTIEIYSNLIKHFLNWSNKDIYHISGELINKYLKVKVIQENKSDSWQNQFINSVKNFWRLILNKKIYPKWIPRPKNKEKLPNVIPETHLKESLSKIPNLKHRVILSLTYSVGLRLGDVQNMKLSDLSSGSMNIKVCNGKGAKDTYLPLYPKVKDLLFEYCKKYKPINLLFEGQGENVYSASSLNKLVKKYFGQKYHFHNIRHSFATHLLDKGVDITYIQKMLRHKDIKTTMIYLNISTQSLKNLPQLID